MPLTNTVLCCLSLVAACAQYCTQIGHSAFQAQQATQTSIHQPPPTQTPPPAEDTARYVAWMDERGTPVKDKARENVSLRLGDWGFFYHGLQFRDRTALDRAGHVITMSETGDWQAFLSTTRLDAGGALKRVAWLFNASGIEPSTAPPKVGSRDQLTVPTLTAADGVITFQGWFLFNRGEFPPDLNDPKRVTITAAKNTARVVTESARKP